MSSQPATVHHYVPQWYQKRFLKEGQHRYYYLDLRPDIVRNPKATYARQALLRWGPKRCFYREHLYTVALTGWTTDEIEKRFFGGIDQRGRQAITLMANYLGDVKGMNDAVPDLPQYMDAQRFRTPRGLAHLQALTAAPDRNRTLLAMQRVFQLHTTMWAEGVWEIARARQSATKFIVTDEPVTFYNRRFFPSECRYPGDVGLEQCGTRTIFPLGMDDCLIITHTQLVRNPWIKPDQPRVNPRAYQQVFIHLLKIQFGRELEEDEVLRINFILKRRATRYIAAAESEWLYPERRVSTTDWEKLDHDWFLFPHLWKVPFSSGIMVGFRDGSAFAADEYGRHPNNPRYQHKKLHAREWEVHLRAQKEWAIKREGRSLAHVHSFDRSDEVGDKLMQEHLQEQRTRTVG